MQKPSILALLGPATLGLAACGSPQAEQQADTQAATLDQPGFEDKAVTAGQAHAEALELVGHLESADMDRTAKADALEDLDRLINANIIEFPKDMRAKLSEDVTSARSAFENKDEEGLQVAAASIRAALTGTQMPG